MPKSRRRRTGASTQSTATKGRETVAARGGTQQPSAAAQRDRAFVSPTVRGPQSLIWPLVVACACGGLAIFYYFFSQDPNHVLFAGLVALLALLWSYSFGVRLRKVLRQRART